MASYNLGPLEQEVMDCVWDKKNVSVSDILKCLQKKRKIAYTTVMTTMTRLTSKGFLIRKLQGKAYIYYPKKSKGQTLKNVIRKTLNSLVDQYGKEAVTAFTDELRNYTKTQH